MLVASLPGCSGRLGEQTEASRRLMHRPVLEVDALISLAGRQADRRQTDRPRERKEQGGTGGRHRASTEEEEGEKEEEEEEEEGLFKANAVNRG